MKSIKKATSILTNSDKELPKEIKIPMQIASKIPVVVTGAKALTLVMETTLSASADVSNDNHSNNVEVER